LSIQTGAQGAPKTTRAPTYYLRSRSATHVEKSTLKGTDGKLIAVSAVASAAPAAAPIAVNADPPGVRPAPSTTPPAKPGSKRRNDDARLV
jgi:hypothetical protein